MNETASWWTTLRDQLHAAGATLVGAADVAETVEGHEWREIGIRLREWLARGEHGAMEWLAREGDVATRIDPRQRYPWVRGAVAAAFAYNTLPSPADALALGEGVRADGGGVKISRYAHGLDYHLGLQRRLKAAKRATTGAHPGLQLRWYVDTGPVLERQWAARAGLGWLGRNSLLIHPRLGSWFFLAVVFTSEPPPREALAPPVHDHCGTCHACVEACPTAALDGHGKLDARRCLSYLTIEDPAPAPPLLAERHGGWLFGCDICQQVCPFNRRAPAVADAAFAPLADWSALSPAEFAALTEEEFYRRFRHTPTWRPRLPKLKATLGLIAPTPHPRATSS